MFLFILSPSVFTASVTCSTYLRRMELLWKCPVTSFAVAETSFPALDAKASGSYAGLL